MEVERRGRCFVSFNSSCGIHQQLSSELGEDTCKFENMAT